MIDAGRQTMPASKRRHAIRRLIASNWTAAAIGALLVIVHAIWFARSDHRADVISGFGVAIADLGLFVTAQPFIRHGLHRTARQQYNLTSEQRLQELRERADEAEVEAVRHVMKERVVGVVLIAVGTLFNGYAGALGHLIGSP